MDYYYFEDGVPTSPGMKHFIDLSNRYDEFISNFSCYKLTNFVFEKDYSVESLIRPIYEWMLEYIGPSADMVWDIERLIFDSSPPVVPSNSLEWNKTIQFVFDCPTKWLLCESVYVKSSQKVLRGIAFNTEESAMLFKLTWG